MQPKNGLQKTTVKRWLRGLVVAAFEHNVAVECAHVAFVFAATFSLAVVKAHKTHTVLAVACSGVL